MKSKKFIAIFCVVSTVPSHKELDKISGKFYVRLTAQAQFVRDILRNIIGMHRTKQQIIRCNVKTFADPDERVKTWLLPAIFNRRHMIVGYFKELCKFSLLYFNSLRRTLIRFPIS